MFRPAQHDEGEKLLFKRPLSGASRQRIVIATRNPHKTREIAAILGPQFATSDLTAGDDVPVVAETGVTFEENAILKAVAASRLFDCVVLSDDSGLEVDALGGAPGVYSARYAGEAATDAENLRKLIEEMKRVAVPDATGTARFRCVIAAATQGSLIRTFHGVIEGIITNEPRGAGGFGYDPVFIPAGYDRTFAELPASLKNFLSHRAQALEKARAFLLSFPR